MEIVCLIPARGGSKGVLKKNLRQVGACSLVANRILEAKKLGSSTRVYVSTDNLEIEREAVAHGSFVINRPPELARDETSTDDVILHAITKLKLSMQDIVILLQPTSPFLSSVKISECLESLVSNPRLSSVITVREGHPFMWETQDNLSWEPLGHSREFRLRRQQFSHQGWETGGCYAIKVDQFMKQKVRYPHPTGCISVNLVESLDIDTEEDLLLAQKIASVMEF